MNAAIQKFETVSFLRGGRISGFLDRQRTTFFVSKKLMEVTRIDENGKAVRVMDHRSRGAGRRDGAAARARRR